MASFVWTIKPTLASLEARKFEQKIKRAVGLIGLIMAITSLAIFAYQTYWWLGSSRLIIDSFFPANPSARWWWLCVFFICFSFYRIISETVNKKTLRHIGEVVEVENYLGYEIWQMIEESFQYARKFNHAQVDEVHFLAGMLKTKTGQSIFSRLGIDPEKLFKTIGSALSRLPRGHNIGWHDKLSKVLCQSAELAVSRRSKFVEVGEVLQVIATGESLAKTVMEELAIEPVMIENISSWFAVRRKMIQDRNRRLKKASWRPRHSLDRAYLAVATPLLDKLSRDLTYEAANGYLKPFLGRDKEIQEIFRIIEGGRSSVLLVGEPGVGKTALVEGIAQAMVAEEVPAPLVDKKLYLLSVTSLVGSTTSAGQVEQMVTQVLNEIARAGNIILYIDDIQNLVGISMGTEGTLDVADVIANFIRQGQIITLASTTPADYRSVISKSSLGQEMQEVKIAEPENNQAIQILEGTVGYLEYQHNVYFSYGAMATAVDLSRRYMPDHYLPDKAIKLCEEVAIFSRQKKGQNGVITGEDVAQLVASKVNVPVTQVSKPEGEKLLNLENILHQRIIGQDEAVKSVASALRRARVELRTSSKPISTFLFLGPTGVGKTELAKTVAQEYFGGENKMIRLDMSEYQTAESMYRLIGAPPGMGNSSGYLTEAIHSAPYSLILLDEFEKAHPDILNVFLQMFDDGRLTDSTGKTVDFTNSIIIATSNAGTQFIQESLQAGQTIVTIKQALISDHLKKYFKPELLNRFDGVIVFKPLNFDEVVQITKLLLKKLETNLEKRGIHFKATDKVIEELARSGFDPIYGARPLQRAIQENVDNALANYLLTGKLTRRDVVILEPGGVVRVEKAEQF